MKADAKTIRVLHLIPSLSEGGAPLGALELARRQFERGQSVRVVVLGSPAFDMPLSWPMAIDYLGHPLLFGSGKSRRATLEIANQYFTKTEFDLVHCHLWPAAYVGSALAPKWNRPVVIHIRDTPQWLSSNTLRNRWKRFLFRRNMTHPLIHFVAVSQGAADFARNALRLPSPQVTTILNAIDPRRFSTERKRIGDKNRFEIGMVGRLSPEKGHLDFLRALELVTNSNWHCHVVGQGSMRGELQAFADKISIEKFSFSPNVDNLNLFYRGLDTLAVPSRSSEGLPRVVMEAMWCGTPVIATDSVGIRDVVETEIDGIVVPVGDCRAMALQVERMMGESDWLMQLGERAQTKAHEWFGIDRMLGELDSLYSHLIKPGSSRR